MKTEFTGAEICPVVFSTDNNQYKPCDFNLAKCSIIYLQPQK